MAVITISRQYGSGDEQIAAKVCKLLGYRYFDKRLMAQIASEVGLSEDEIVDFSETNYKIRGFWERLFGWRHGPNAAVQDASWAADVAGPQPGQTERRDEKYSINLVQSTIHAAYRHDNVLIVGRGGQAILKDAPGVLHVRLEAPLDARAWHVQDEKKISLAERALYFQGECDTSCTFGSNENENLECQRLL